MNWLILRNKGDGTASFRKQRAEFSWKYFHPLILFYGHNPVLVGSLKRRWRVRDRMKYIRYLHQTWHPRSKRNWNGWALFTWRSVIKFQSNAPIQRERNKSDTILSMSTKLILNAIINIININLKWLKQNIYIMFQFCLESCLCMI